MSSLLLVAGEPSGDRIAAGVARVLGEEGVRCFGMGGAASAAAGVELVADIRRSAAMGFTEVAARLPAIVTAYARLARVAPPRAALLVNYTEFNLRLGARLRRQGVPVLWCVAPQVWAWRAGRVAHVARALDRMAVILPFEEPLWRRAGVDAHYVGHPALDTALPDRAAARARLHIAQGELCVALLPGSRAHEVRRHTTLMLASLREFVQIGRTTLALDARIVASPWLDDATRVWLTAQAAQANVPLIEVDPTRGASEHLAAFDVSIAASGTATLESALAGAPPIIVYRASRLTAAIARRLVRTPDIGLPNIVLGSRRYPELVDDGVEPRRIARELAAVLERRSIFEATARELRQRLASPRGENGRTSSERVASLLRGWLGLAPRRVDRSKVPHLQSEYA